MAYAGILPGMFRDGQGTLVTGRLDASGVFLADEVLAEHDENHLPPEMHDIAEGAADAPPR